MATSNSDLLSMLQGSSINQGMPLNQKIEKATQLKEEGNGYFRTGEIKKAIISYNQAVMYLLNSDLSKAKTSSPADSLRVTVELNLAACHLKLGDLHKTIVHCDKLLAIEPTNIKGLWRRAKAYMQQGSWAAAVDDLELALKTEPSNADVRKDYAVAKKNSDAVTQQRKSKMAGMFKVMAEEDEKETKKSEPFSWGSSTETSATAPTPAPVPAAAPTAAPTPATQPPM